MPAKFLSRPSAAHLSRRQAIAGLLSAAVMPALAPAGSMISTMRGPVSCNSLGTTLMHEHVLWFAGPGLQHVGYTPIPEALRSESVDFAVSQLKAAAQAGIRTLVDLTPHRPIDLYQQIASRTDVNIVPSTGFYRRAKIPGELAEMEEEQQMEDRMHKDVSEGIDGTSIRAGIIKVASEGAPLTDWERKVFRATGRVQAKTHVPIATHSGPPSAPEQHELLVRSGADPRLIMLSHMDVGTESHPERLKALLPLLKQGTCFEVDTFGQDFYTPWSHLVTFLRFFCDAGFAGQLFISVDSNWHWENGVRIFEGAEPPARDPNASKRTYAYMMTAAVPRLLESGFSKKEIETFLVDNPRRFFCNA